MNKTINIVPKDKCTGCGACAYICPNQCIKMEEDSLGVIYPAIDKGLCVGEAWFASDKSLYCTGEEKVRYY